MEPIQKEKGKTCSKTINNSKMIKQCKWCLKPILDESQDYCSAVCSADADYDLMLWEYAMEENKENDLEYKRLENIVNATIEAYKITKRNRSELKFKNLLNLARQYDCALIEVCSTYGPINLKINDDELKYKLNNLKMIFNSCSVRIVAGNVHHTGFIKNLYMLLTDHFGGRTFKIELDERINVDDISFV